MRRKDGGKCSFLQFLTGIIIRSPLAHTLLASLPVLLLMTQCASRISVYDPVMRVRSGQVVSLTSSPYLTTEFARAQRNLIAGTLLDNVPRRGLHTFTLIPRLSEKSKNAVAKIDPSGVRVQIVKEEFQCGRKRNRVMGCFLPFDIDVPIILNVALPGAAYHEFVHLLLHRIEDARWDCSLHDYNFNGKWDCNER